MGQSKIFDCELCMDCVYFYKFQLDEYMEQYADIKALSAKTDSHPSLLDELAHSAIIRAVRAVQANSKHAGTAMYCIDATAGNGHDTCFLAGLGASLEAVAQKNFSVLACDVQEEALHNTREQLHQYGLQAELVHTGHENIAEYLPEKSLLVGVMFNLGYLPNKDRNAEFIVTKADTTLQAISSLAERLSPRGVISVHCYTGHAGGLTEYQAVHDFITRLEPKFWRALCVSDINRSHNSEYLFLLEKLQIKQRKQYVKSCLKRCI